jgi:putative NADH-flavin reductase
MKVTLFGASGTIGSRILDELLSRGHQVTAVVRDPAKIQAHKVPVIPGDVLDPAAVAQSARGADAAISAYAAPMAEPEKLLIAVRNLIAGLTQAGVHRFIMVSGAGGLEVAPGLQLVNTPQFPAAWHGIAIAHRDALPILGQSDRDWTAFSPAALIEPGERTGKFRLDTDKLVVDQQGNSRISAEDYAMALVDELETPRHIRQRFTIGY